jgi:hypothetical protein
MIIARGKSAPAFLMGSKWAAVKLGRPASVTIHEAETLASKSTRRPGKREECTRRYTHAATCVQSLISHG